MSRGLTLRPLNSALSPPACAEKNKLLFNHDAVCIHADSAFIVPHVSVCPNVGLKEASEYT